MKAQRAHGELGFTVIELLSVMSIIGLLAALAIPRLQIVVKQAKVARAIGDIRSIQTELMSIEASGQALPVDLSGIGRAGTLDPWGRPYQYLVITSSTLGAARKDRFLVPVNSTFDLYSMGEDGSSVAALTAGPSQDDVVRANDGGFIGLGSKF
jgi:general secretion pathway protein G